MHRQWIYSVIVWGMAAGIYAQSERLYIVKVANFGKDDEYKVVTEADYKATSDDLRQEARFIDKAYEQAKAEWKARQIYKKPFPLPKPQPRTMIKIEAANNQDAAAKKLEAIESRITRAADSKAEREANKMKSADEATRKKLEEKEERRKMMEDAVAMFVEKIQALRQAQKEKEDAAKEGAAKTEGGESKEEGKSDEKPSE
jgi:hypothetical protein